MDYAIIKDGIVTNIAVANYPVECNWIATNGMNVSIGDAYDGESFFHDENKILTEEEKLRIEVADMRKALNLMGVVVDG